MDSRERLGSRLGFILLSAGCAIGCGNVWKFPWMCGQNGGGCFVLVYIACLVILALPSLVMEFSVGRAAQSSAIFMFNRLEKKGAKWHLWGGVCLFGNLVLMAFYTVVSGWLIYYFVMFAMGQNQSLSFGEMLASPAINVSFMALSVVVAFLVLCLNIQSGLEIVTKYMMIILIVLMVILAIHSIMLPNALEGLGFYLTPDITKIDGSVVVAAMNQAFFTVSIGIGSMAIFGSYIGKERALLGESVNVIVLDTFVAIVSGLIIFPACTSYGIEVQAGPSLLFDTMATVFNNIAGGRWWGSMFFLFMVFAAMSTVFAVCENILAMVRELTGWNRPKGCILCAAIVILMALTTALGFNVIQFTPFAKGSTWLDLWDFILSNNILPLGALCFVLFCCTSYGWGWENFVKEANTGLGPKVRAWMKPWFMYVIPVIIVFIYVGGLLTFNWR